MKKRIALSIAIIIALLGTVVFATEYLPSTNVSDVDKAAGIMPLSEELTPSVDANTLKNTTVVSDSDEDVTNPIPESWWRGEVTEDMWRDGEDGAKKTLSTDHFKADENLTVSDVVVDGNAFYAGQDVSVKNVEIYGDLFIAGKDVELEKVYVSGNIYAAGQSVTLSNSNIVGNAYVAGEAVSLKTVTIQDVFGGAAQVEINNGSTIYRNVNIGAEKVIIDNSQIGRLANIGADSISIGSAATISGLNYYSENEATIAQGANIANVAHKVATVDDEEVEAEESPVKEMIMKVVSGMVQAAIVCGFIFLCAKGFVEKQKVDNKVPQIGFSILKGIGWAVLIPVIAILLMCTGVAVGLAFVVIMLYIAIFAVSTSVVSVSISAAFTKGKEVNTWAAYGLSLIVALAITLLKLIPGVGEVISMVVAFAGMGLVLASLKSKKASKKEEPVVSEEA